MRLKSFLRFLCFCPAIVVALSISVFAQNDKIDVPALLKEAKQKSDDNLQRSMDSPPSSFKWRKTWRKAEKEKIVERSELYEYLVPLKCPMPWMCRFVDILLEEDGKKVSAEKIEKERLEAAKEIEKMETAEEVPLKRDHNDNWLRFYHYRVLNANFIEIIIKIDGQEMLEKCEFFAPEREQINGRDAISLKFRPRADAVFGKETAYLKNAEGKIWIDAEDKVIFRILIWQRGTKFEKETSDHLLERAAVVYDMTRTTESFWYLRLGEFRGLKNSLLEPMKDDFIIEEFDYQFFKTEIKNVEIDKPKQ